MGRKPIFRTLVVDGSYKDKTKEIVDWYVNRGRAVIIDEIHHDYYSVWELTNITDVWWKELLDDLHNNAINEL